MTTLSGMLSTVLIVCVLFFTRPSHAQERPCTTLRTTLGNCVKREQCALPLGSAVFNESLCGFDLDGGNMYCCEQKTKQVLTNFRGLVETEYRPSSTTTERSIRTTTNQPESTTSYVVNQSEVTNVTGTEQSCLTPNGEVATCIPIHRCLIFTKLISQRTMNKDQINYIRESKCGYNETHLVCCGTKVDFDTAPDEFNNGNFVKNSLIPDTCGLQLINRIFGGADTDSHDFPWLALLEYDQSGSRTFLCDGSLISSRYVLTAAHCISGRNAIYGNKLINVRLGEWDTSSSDKNCPGMENLTQCNPLKKNFGIDSVHPHPNYNITTKHHDIGLIRLDQEVQYNDLISPICLPPPDSYMLPGDRLTVSGWGLKSYSEMATTKQRVELPVIATSECSLAFQDTLKIRRGQFCAGGEARKDACNGDSGAPLMRLSADAIPRWSIEGIVSFGIGCGQVGRYGVYTKVSEYLGWIHNTIML